MTFKTTKENKVPYIMVAGADYVTGEMPLSEVQHLYDEGTKRASNRFPGYPVCVNEKYFFAIKTDIHKTGSGRKRKNA